MDDPPGVCRGQALRERERDLHGAPPRERSLLQPGLECLPLEKLRDGPQDAVLGAHVVDVEDVRVREGRDGAGLPVEPGAGDAVGGQAVREDLDRDVALQPGVAGFPDLAHPSRTERRENLVRTESVACVQCHVASTILVPVANPGRFVRTIWSVRRRRRRDRA